MFPLFFLKKNLGGPTAVRHYCHASLLNLVFLSLLFCVRSGDRLLKVVLTLPVILVLLFRFGGVMSRFTLYKIDFALSLSQNSNQLARLLCKYHFNINVHLISYFSVDVLS